LDIFIPLFASADFMLPLLMLGLLLR